MQVFNLRAWLIAEQIRIRYELFWLKGQHSEKTRKLVKRSLHIEHILKQYK